MRVKYDEEKVGSVCFYFSDELRANYKAKLITRWSWNEDDLDFNKFCSWLFKENTRAV